MILTTQRLLIRELRLTDLEAVQEFESDPEVRWFEGEPLMRAETLYRLEGAVEWAAEHPRTRYKLGVTLPQDDFVIGRVALTLNNRETSEWEIGWTFNQRFWGNGFATEAAWALLDYAFGELNAHRVAAFCHAENTASYRVMEKLGMRREGYLRETRLLRGRYCDELAYAILQNEFRLSNSSV